MRADPRLDRRAPQRGDQRRSALLEALDEALHDQSLESINVADISSRATSPFAVMSPEPSRSGSSTDWVGCACMKPWLGVGSP